GDGVVPVAADRPVRGRRRGGRAGEAVGEDLVDDGLAGPRRRGRVGEEPEVGVVGDVVPDVAEHRVPVAVDVEAVAGDGVADLDPAPPPQLPGRAGPALHRGGGEARLTVLDGPHRPPPDAGRGAQPDVPRGPEAWVLVRHVEGRTVVMRHPFPAPVVRPDTMYRCR